MAKKTAASKLWKVHRQKVAAKKAELGPGRRFERLNGKLYEYPCYAKGHTHNLDCCTPEMWDACSELAYENAQR